MREVRGRRVLQEATATVAMPSAVITSDAQTWSAISVSAQPSRPCCKCATTSAENVENVESPPISPVMMNSRHSIEISGKRAKKATATPMM